MIEQIVSEVFRRIGQVWKVGNAFIYPDEEDVRQVLDEGAKTLYDGAIGDRLELGGLIMEKRPKGHDVYIYIGNYE